MNVIRNTIQMPAPRQKVFEVVSDLTAWPKHLPHYRWIRILENQKEHQVVRMACYRGWIPIDWVSRFRADAATYQLHFDHLKAFTRGMHVVWHLEPVHEKATQVTITHELEPVAKRLGNFAAHRMIGHFFIDYVATRTLKHFALYFEKKAT